MVFMGVEELVIRLRTVNELGGFDQLANRIQSIDSLINKFSSKVSDISKSIISELSKIDNIDFNKITTNFQSVSDKLGSDAQKASQIATAELSKINTVDFNRISSYSQAASQIATNELSKINTVQFNKLYNNFKSISDIIGRDSRTASQIATSELNKINTVDFNKINTNFSVVVQGIAREAQSSSQIAISELAKINTVDFNNISIKFKAATGQMNNDAMSAADSSTSQLQKINMLDFSGLSNKFKSAVQQMANDARSVADTVSSSFQNMSQGLDGMVAGLGGVVGMNKLFQESQQKAALGWRMNNITSSDEASKITSAYVQYDIGSSRADADLTTMMNLLVGSGELTSKNTARSLGILDAISANADPLKQRGAMYGFGAYLSGGYESAKGKLRDEGLTDSQLERMEAAKTYQERLNVLQEIALERGQLQIGQNGELVGLYNTMTGEIGGYNKALALLDRVVQAGTEAFMGFMDILSPVFDFLSNLPEPVWDLIGAFAVFAGAAGIVVGVISGIGAVIPGFVSGLGLLNVAIGVLTPGLSAATAAGAGFRTSLGVLVTRQTLATVGNYGFLASLVSTVTGMNAAEASTLGLTASFKAMGASLLANPIFWIAAVILGVAAAVIYLKTQTELLSSVTEKGARAMDSMNQRLELLQGQHEAVGKKVDDLRAKLDTLTKGTHEYEVTWKNYEAEKAKLDEIKSEIKEIESIKGSAEVAASNWDRTSLKIDKLKENAYQGTGVDPHINTSSENIAAFQNNIGQSEYYRDLTEKSVVSLSKLSNAQKKTFNGKQLAQYANKMEQIGELEEKAFKLSKEGKELDWFEQIELSNLKNQADQMAGINPWDDENTRIRKREALSKGDLSKVDDGSLLEQINKLFSDAGNAISKGWDDFSKWISEGASKIGSDIGKSWDGLVKWFDNGIKGIQGWFNGLPGWFQQQFQGLADWFSNLPSWLSSKVGDLWSWLKDSVKDIPVIGDLAKGLDSIFDSLKSKDIGQMISDMITKTDWVSVGVTLAESLWSGIESVLRANPIIDMLWSGAETLTGGNQGMNPGTQPVSSFNPFSGLQLPQLDWNNFISPWSVESWGGKIKEWSSVGWLGKITNWSWTGWLGKITNWTKSGWDEKIVKWDNWTKKVSEWTKKGWDGKITAVNLADFVSGVIFGAGNPGYVNTDFGKGDLYEGPSYDYSAISSDSFVDSSSSNSSSVVNSNNTVHVTVEGNVDSDDRADDVANRVLSQMAFGLNKDNNANQR